MKAHQDFTLKEGKLNKNCPECYSNHSLEFTFKQELIDTRFYKAITGETVSEIYCANCEVQIFPIRWTDDIEQVVDYHKRAIKIKPKSVKLKSLSWVLIAIVLFLIVVSILFATDIINFK